MIGEIGEKRLKDSLQTQDMMEGSSYYKKKELHMFM